MLRIGRMRIVANKAASQEAKKPKSQEARKPKSQDARHTGGPQAKKQKATKPERLKCKDAPHQSHNKQCKKQKKKQKKKALHQKSTTDFGKPLTLYTPIYPLKGTPNFGKHPSGCQSVNVADAGRFPCGTLFTCRCKPTASLRSTPWV